MSSVIHAIYENGVIRPFGPVGLADGDEVDVFLLKKDHLDPQRTRQTLNEIADLPIEGEPDNFSGENHDEVLYPKA